MSAKLHTCFGGLALLGIAPLVLAAAGCSRCSDEPRVPFKLHPAPEAGAIADDGYDASVPLPSVFAEPVDRPVLGALPLPLTRVRAVLERDFDGDGALDALALHEDEAQRARLSWVARTQAGFGAAREVSAFAQPSAGCTVSAAQLDALSTTKAAALVTFACGEPAGATTLRASLALLSIESAPRLFERVDVLGTAPTGEPPVVLSVSSLDADGDGHDDVRLLAKAPGASDEDALPLLWLDRPSGLLRDLHEPEATLSSWASAAQGLAGSSPDQALARAELALTLQRAICRELDEPAVALSGTPGIPCGPSKSGVALLATVVGAHVRRGEMSAAFESYRALVQLGPKPNDRALEQASKALSRLPAEPDVTLRRGPAVEPVHSPRVHLPSARFLHDSLLYVQRARPVLYDVERATESPAAGTADALVRDPSGQFVATAIERSCEGHTVRIERAPPPGSDYVPAAPVSLPVLSPAPSAPGCTRASARPEDDGFHLLGWAPQGLVAARGSEVRVVPLASDARPSAPTRILAPDAPRPAPLPSGRATADGARYVEATPFGVLVRGPSSTRVEIWRPAGYTEIVKGQALEVAISPSGQRIALVAGGSVYLLERSRPGAR